MKVRCKLKSGVKSGGYKFIYGKNDCPDDVWKSLVSRMSKSWVAAAFEGDKDADLPALDVPGRLTRVSGAPMDRLEDLKKEESKRDGGGSKKVLAALNKRLNPKG